MSDEGRRRHGETDAGDELVELLAELRPLMLEQERVEAEEPDPAFLQTLRVRLTGEEAVDAPSDPPAFPSLYRWLGRGSRLPLQWKDRLSTRQWIVPAVGLTVAVILVMAVLAPQLLLPLLAAVGFAVILVIRSRLRL